MNTTLSNNSEMRVKSSVATLQSSVATKLRHDQAMLPSRPAKLRERVDRLNIGLAHQPAVSASYALLGLLTRGRSVHKTANAMAQMSADEFSTYSERLGDPHDNRRVHKQFQNLGALTTGLGSQRQIKQSILGTGAGPMLSMAKASGI